MRFLVRANLCCVYSFVNKMGRSEKFWDEWEALGTKSKPAGRIGAAI